MLSESKFQPYVLYKMHTLKKGTEIESKKMEDIYHSAINIKKTVTAVLLWDKV